MTDEMTDAQLWDYLHEHFGFGDWDEASDRDPWWKFRGTAIGRLKGMKRKRRISTRELVNATEYVLETGKHVTALWELFGYVGEANAWTRKRAHLDRQAAVVTHVEDAIAEALEAGEREWAERLMRVGPKEAQTVINEWRAAR